jgi:AraC family transcriptional regulator
MNDAMDYIEANLAEEISYGKAAQTACCSAYHFQRMFSFITGVTLSEYIRRRRLTLAAFELQTSGGKVIDMALKYGYESPEAFSRAFKSLHGVTPVLARDTGASLKAYPKMTFSISIKGDIEMNYRVEQRETFEVFGVYSIVSSDMEQAFSDVPRFVKEKMADGTWDRFNDFLGRPRDMWFHAALLYQTDESLKFMMCAYAPPELCIPETYTRLNVPAQTWAIFPSPKNDVKDTWRRIFTEWFPTSEYEQVEGPSFEMWYGYGRGDFGYGASEVWIPVKKR